MSVKTGSARTWKERLLGATIPVLVLAAGVGAGSVVINSKPEVAESETGPVLRAVNALVAEAHATTASVSGQGTVEPRQRITLVPQVSGLITWVAPAFVNGGRFRAGDTLLRIDDRDYLLAVTSAEAAVADAEQQLATAKAQAEQAESEWALLQRTAPTALALRKPQLQSAEARLLSARAELQRARLQLTRTAIVAPFNGMLTDKQVDYGQFVSAGTQVGQLASSEELEVRLALPERALANLDISALGAGTGVLPLVVQGLSGTAGVWQGRLVRSEGLIDPQTRNLTVVAQFSGSELYNDKGETLTIGQFVRASISGNTYGEVFTLPRTALHKGGSVFVVDAEQRLRERPVTVLEMHAEHIVVADGIKAGEVISISPLTSSVEGQNVQVLLVNQSGAFAEGALAEGAVR